MTLDKNVAIFYFDVINNLCSKKNYFNFGVYLHYTS